METLDRITSTPGVLGGMPCIRGMRISASTVIGMVAGGYSFERILEAYPYLEREDIVQALSFGALLARTREFDLSDAA